MDSDIICTVHPHVSYLFFMLIQNQSFFFFIYFLCFFLLGLAAYYFTLKSQGSEKRKGCIAFDSSYKQMQQVQIKMEGPKVIKVRFFLWYKCFLLFLFLFFLPSRLCYFMIKVSNTLKSTVSYKYRQSPIVLL